MSVLEVKKKELLKREVYVIGLGAFISKIVVPRICVVCMYIARTSGLITKEKEENKLSLFLSSSPTLWFSESFD